MKNAKQKSVINQMVLEKMGNSDEFITEVIEEVKPSRIDSRRQRAEQHEKRKKNSRKYFEEYSD